MNLRTISHLPVSFCKSVIALCLALTFQSVLPFSSIAQDTPKHKIAVFTPLYLDSAFDADGNFRYEKTGAKFSNPGLDFYLGVQMALDSLAKRGAPLEVFVYDTKGKEQLVQQLNSDDLEDAELIIAQSNAAETKALAEAAMKKKIPFVSATLPNDAGIYDNPYMVVLNTTLQAHIEGIYRFLQRYHAQDKIVVFRKSGTQEDQIKNHIEEFAKSTSSNPLKIKFVDVPDLNPQIIKANIDTIRRTVVIAGSLDEAFGMKLAQTLATFHAPIRMIGMPTWDNFNFGRLDSDLEIIYTTPFFYNRGSALETQLATEFGNKMYARPSDLFFKGYEATLRFGLLLLDTKKDIASNLTRKGNTVLTQFDIQPVFKDKSSMTLDYFENKHLYFVKVFGGVKNIVY